MERVPCVPKEKADGAVDPVLAPKDKGLLEAAEPKPENPPPKPLPVMHVR